MIITPDEARAYVLSYGRLVAVSLAEGSVLHDVPISVSGTLAVSCDGSQVLVSEPRGECPVSGYLHHYSDALELRHRIHLDTPDLPGSPAAARDAAISPDGKTAYVLSGTAALGLCGQSSAIHIVDLEHGAVIAQIPLNEPAMNPRIFLIMPLVPASSGW